MNCVINVATIQSESHQNSSENKATRATKPTHNTFNPCPMSQKSKMNIYKMCFRSLYQTSHKMESEKIIF